MSGVPFLWRELTEIKNKYIYLLVQVIAITLLSVNLEINIRLIEYYGFAFYFFLVLSSQFSRELKQNIEVTLTLPYSILYLIKVKTRNCLYRTFILIIPILIASYFFSAKNISIISTACLLKVLQYILFLFSLYFLGVIIASYIWILNKSAFISNFLKIAFYGVITVFEYFKYRTLGYLLLSLVFIVIITILKNHYNNEKILYNGGK